MACPLAAFRSWGEVQAFVRTDTAGADLAAGVRLIDKQGAAAVLATVEQLSGPRRADLVVSTAHRAKGLEWDSVLIASDFQRTGAARPVARTEAMLAYVAVTRARTGLDQTGLAWIDTHTGHTPATRATAAGTITKEITMNKTEFDVGFDEDTSSTALLDGDPHVAAAPYAGGRAQAEDGSKIVENDYYGWLSIALQPHGLEPSHPRIAQLGEAWRVVSRAGLGDDPGAASIRYQVLAHAAGALVGPVRDADLASEAEALLTLRQHALIHGRRLYATSTDLFTRSGKSGPYSGRGQASGGSLIIEKDYQRWIQTPAAGIAATDPDLWEQAANLHQACADVSRYGLADGPGLAASRYRMVAGCARNLAQDFTYRLPSAALAPLLELASHADKHAIRLSSTAIGRTSDTATDYEALCQATWERSSPADSGTPYRGLPAQVATTATRAHAETRTHVETPHGGQAPAAAEGSPARQTIRKRAAQNERA
jgi:UvrD-like helicase C-terminal domain